MEGPIELFQRRRGGRWLRIWKERTVEGSTQKPEEGKEPCPCHFLQGFWVYFDFLGTRTWLPKAAV